MHPFNNLRDTKWSDAKHSFSQNWNLCRSCSYNCTSWWVHLKVIIKRQYTNLLATRSTDLLEGPQYSTVFLPLPSSSSWRLTLQNRYTSLMPVFVLPEPVQITHSNHQVTDLAESYKLRLWEILLSSLTNKQTKTESVTVRSLTNIWNSSPQCRATYEQLVDTTCFKGSKYDSDL